VRGHLSNGHRHQHCHAAAAQIYLPHQSAREAADYAGNTGARLIRSKRRTLVVTDPSLDGLRLDAIPRRAETGVTIARVRHGQETSVATDATIIRRGDRIAVVGTRSGLDEFERVVGQGSDEDLVLTESNITFRRVLVTNRRVLGQAVGELDLDDRFGVAVTRITRADIEMSAVPGLRLPVRRHVADRRP